MGLGQVIEGFTLPMAISKAASPLQHSLKVGDCSIAVCQKAPDLTAISI